MPMVHSSPERSALATDVIECLQAGRVLPSGLERALEQYLDDTWPERVPDVAYGRYVSLEKLATYVLEQSSLSPDEVERLVSSDLLAIAADAIDTIISSDDELDLPGATIVELRDASGRTAWLVDCWGGGYIASGPPHEFLGPFHTEFEARRRHSELGYRDSSELAESDLASLMEMIDELGRLSLDS